MERMRRMYRLAAGLAAAATGAGVVAWSPFGIGQAREAVGYTPQAATVAEYVAQFMSWQIGSLGLVHMLAAGLGIALPATAWWLLEASQWSRTARTWSWERWDVYTAWSGAATAGVAAWLWLAVRGAWIQAGAAEHGGGIGDALAVMAWGMAGGSPVLSAAAMILTSSVATTFLVVKMKVEHREGGNGGGDGGEEGGGLSWRPARRSAGATAPAAR